MVPLQPLLLEWVTCHILPHIIHHVSALTFACWWEDKMVNQLARKIFTVLGSLTIGWKNHLKIRGKVSLILFLESLETWNVWGPLKVHLNSNIFRQQCHCVLHNSAKFILKRQRPNYVLHSFHQSNFWRQPQMTKSVDAWPTHQSASLVPTVYSSILDADGKSIYFPEVELNFPTMFGNLIDGSQIAVWCLALEGKILQNYEKSQ